MNKKFILVIICFFLIGFIIYIPGIHASRYSDDFTIVPEGNLKVDIIKIWTTSYQRAQFYRPIEDTITALAIYAFGWNTLPTHILYVILHCSIVSFIYYVFIKLRFSLAAVFFGALFMLVAQGNVMTVGGNAVLGQLLSCLLCLIALWLMYNAIIVEEKQSRLITRLYLSAVILFILGLLSKESAVTFLPMLLVLLIFKNLYMKPLNNLKRSLILLSPFIISFLIFYIIRSIIVPLDPVFGKDRYDLNIGLNIPKNIGMLLFSILLPVSSVRTFEAIQLKDHGFLVVAFSVTFLFAGIIFYGVWKSKKYKEAALLICFITAGFLPYALLNHVNEQYSYFTVPFAAMLIGIGLSYFVNNLKGLKRKILIIIITAFYLLNVIAVMEKTSQMNKLGERADLLFDEIKVYFSALRPNSSLVLVNSPNKGLRYSLFLQPDFEPMRYTDFMMYKMAGRNDFKLRVIDWHEQSEWKSKPGVLMLKLEGDKVMRME